MKYELSTRFLGKYLILGSLLGAFGCSGGDPSSDKSQSPVNGARSQCDEDEDEDDESPDGAEDKITCSVDGDCDSDETCVQGLCTGTDDDEYCSSSLCTGIPESCASDADCDADEACTNGLCEDR